VKASQEDYEIAVQIYDKRGLTGVIDFANAKGITSFSYCDPCDYITPDTHDNACLVCGSLKE